MRHAITLLRESDFNPKTPWREDHEYEFSFQTFAAFASLRLCVKSVYLAQGIGMTSSALAHNA